MSHGTVADVDAAATAQALSPSPCPNRQATVTRAQHQTQAVILTAREGAAERGRIRVTEFEPILWYSILVRGTVPGETTAAAAAVEEASTASSNWHFLSRPVVFWRTGSVVIVVVDGGHDGADATQRVIAYGWRASQVAGCHGCCPDGIG